MISVYYYINLISYVNIIIYYYIFFDSLYINRYIILCVFVVEIVLKMMSNFDCDTKQTTTLLSSYFECKFYKKMFAKYHKRQCSLIHKYINGKSRYQIHIERVSKSKFYVFNLDLNCIKVKSILLNDNTKYAFVIKSNQAKIVFTTTQEWIVNDWIQTLNNLDGLFSMFLL